MKLHFGGIFNGDESKLPKREHPDGYTAFKEPQNMKKFTILMTIASGIVFLFFWIAAEIRKPETNVDMIVGGVVLALLTLIPHEFLHAVFLKKDAYMYVNIKSFSMFVIGTEDMSKSRFIMLSLCPNIVFGAVPYILFMINPQWSVLGSMGAAALSMGVGDYLNVINAVMQVPKGALTYLNGFHSFWYLPRKGENYET